MFEFRKDFTTVVLTHFLIEDYQILQNAYRTGNWEDVQIVMDNIATVIDQSTLPPPDLVRKVKVSESSVIRPSHQEGILIKNGQDIMCINGQPASGAMAAGVCQCDESCPYFEHSCFPEIGTILYDHSADELHSLGLKSVDELGIEKGRPLPSQELF